MLFLFPHRLTRICVSKLISFSYLPVSCNYLYIFKIISACRFMVQYSIQEYGIYIYIYIIYIYVSIIYICSVNRVVFVIFVVKLLELLFAMEVSFQRYTKILQTTKTNLGKISCSDLLTRANATFCTIYFLYQSEAHVMRQAYCFALLSGQAPGSLHSLMLRCFPSCWMIRVWLLSAHVNLCQWAVPGCLGLLS